LDKFTMSAVVFGVQTVALVYAPPAVQSQPGRMVRAATIPFRWFNAAYTLLARVDAAVLPKRLAAIVFMRGEKRPSI
jgi:hypothetical protein